MLVDGGRYFSVKPVSQSVSLSVCLPVNPSQHEDESSALSRQRSGNAGRDSCVVTFHAATRVDVLDYLCASPKRKQPDNTVKNFFTTFSGPCTFFSHLFSSLVIIDLLGCLGAFP